MRIERVALRATTTEGTVAYETDLGPGLNVLAAPNSFGKSTVLQAIVYGLGLEGMLSASHALPVGPAMTTVVDLPDGVREQVVESYVELDLANNWVFRYECGFLREKSRPIALRHGGLRPRHR